MLSPKMFNKLDFKGWLSPRRKEPPKIEVEKETDEVKQFVKLATSRRNQAYEALKVWDKTRADRLGLHRRVIDEVVRYVVEMKEGSEHFVKTVQLFLNGVSQQYKSYSAAKLIVGANTSSPALSNNAFAKISLIQCSTQQKMYQQAAKELQTTCETLRTTTNQPLHRVRLAIEDGIDKLRQLNQTTQKRCGEISEAFHQEHSGPFRNIKDVYKCTVSLLTNAQFQLNEQRNLAKAAVRYLGLVEEQVRCTQEQAEKILLDCSKIFKKYNLRDKNLNESKNPDLAQIYTQPLFQIEKVLSQSAKQAIVDLQKLTGKPIISENSSLENILERILDFETKFAYLNKLIIRQSQVLYKIGKQNEIPTMLTITVDGFIHLCKISTLETNRYSTPQFSFKLDKTISVELVSERCLLISCRTFQSSILGLLNIGVTKQCEGYGKVFELNLQFGSVSECNIFKSNLDMMKTP